MIKILVCGGRNFTDYDLMKKVLDRFPIKTLIRGASWSWGVDVLTLQYSLINGINCFCYPADWSTHGKAAGPIRNSEILKDNPDLALVIAFKGGSGTKDMIKKAIAAGIDVLIVHSETELELQISTTIIEFPPYLPAGKYVLI